MTWHQWQAEYPTLRKMGLSRVRAAVNASGPPRIPVDRIVGVLKEVRAGFGG
jgi:hypothetical protein